jgi:hypothetical protein
LIWRIAAFTGTLSGASGSSGAMRSISTVSARLKDRELTDDRTDA